MVPHHSAAIVSVGDELTLGQKLDTNSRWLSDQLVSRGIIVREHITIPDDLDLHTRTLRRLADCYPLVISTGGLGPTLDDLTRQALAAMMNEALVEDAHALDSIRSIMERRGRAMTDQQRRQALRPVSARCIENRVGTAPGIQAVVSMATGADEAYSAAAPGERATCDVFCLPGPPGEMRPMFEHHVAPLLRPPAGRVVLTRALHCLGIGEGDLARRLGPLMDRNRNPSVGTTASGGIVSIRIRYEGDASGAEQAMKESVRAAGNAAEPFLFGEGNTTIQKVVLDCLRIRGERLVVAESCTAGGLGSLFSETPGSSAVLLGGWITYSNEMKASMLGVPGPLLAAKGAVSAEVAKEMAEGALRAASSAGGAEHALAITGIAGPDGGSESKPVGTVFIARASEGAATEFRRFWIPGDREDVRGRSAQLALMMLRFHLLSLDVPRTLWQVRPDGTAFPNA